MTQEQTSLTMRRNAGGGRPGRRPGRPDTRETIIEAAHHAFTTSGFRTATAKSIADEAGVDPAMINYFFGSRQGLFREVLYRQCEPSARRAAVAENTDDRSQSAGTADFAERLVREMLQRWEQPSTRELLAGMIVTAGDDPRTADLLRAVEDPTIEVIEQQLAGHGMPAEQARRRAAMIVGMSVGLVYERYVVESPAFTAMSLDDLVADFAPAVRGILGT